TFRPGERVTVTLSSSVSADDSGTTRNLRPFSYEFRIPGGSFDQPLGPPTAPSLVAGISIGSIVDLEVGEFSTLPFTPGSEMVLLESSGALRLLTQDVSGAWHAQASIDAATGASGAAPVGMTRTDFDRDGKAEFIVVYSTGLVRTFRLADLQFAPGVALNEPFTTGVTDFVITDFDANGFLDLVVTDGGGFWTVAQRDVLDPQSQTGAMIRELHPTRVSVDGGFQRVEVGDFEADGRPDLLLSGATGHRVFRNASGFEFQATGSLAVEGAITGPRVVDFEGDGDVDVVAVFGSAVRVFVNGGAGIPADGNWTVGFSYPILDDVTNPSDATDIVPEAFEIRNIDGDRGGLPDLAFFDLETRRLGLFRRTAASLTADALLRGAGSIQAFDFTSIEMPRIAIADLGQDTGLDLILFGNAVGSEAPLVFQSAEGVVEVNEADYELSVPSTVTADLTQPDDEFRVVVSGSSATEVEEIDIALSFDSNELELARIVRSATTFPEATDVDLTVDLDAGTVTLAPQVSLAGQNDVPLVEYVFRLVSPEPGNYSYTLQSQSGFALSFLLENGTEVTPVVSTSAGQIVAVSTVDPVANLQCEPTGSDEVLLTWTNPPGGYDPLGIRITRNGATVAILTGADESWSDGSPTSGGATEVSYVVVGVRDGVFSPPAECSQSILPAPVIETCERSSGQLHLAWTSAITYQNYALFVDGGQVALLAGSESSHVRTISDHGHTISLVGLLDTVTSFPAMCSLDDLLTGVTANPKNVSLSFSTGQARVTWSNGEAYDSLTVRRISPATGTTIVGDQLPGSTVAFVDPEELPPGTYRYSVMGTVSGVDSAAIESNPVDFALQPPTSLTCSTIGASVVLNWNLGSSLYEILDVYRDGVLLTTVDPTSTTFTDDSGPLDGSHEYFLRATIAPDSAPCLVTLENRLRVENTITTVGLSAAIELTADLLESVDTFSFTLEFDTDRFTYASLSVPGALPTDLMVVGPTPIDGTTRASIAVTVTNVPVPAGDDVLLAQLFGATPADFAAVGSSPLDVTAGTLGAIDPTLVDGTFTVRGDAVLVGDYTAVEGEELFVLVTGTFDQALTAFTFVMNFDPTVVQAEEVIFSETVSGALGTSFLVSNIDNEEGFVQGTALSITLGTLSPAIDQSLAFVRLVVQPGADGLSTALDFDVPHAFVGSELSTSFATASAQTIDPFTVPGLVTVGVVDPDPPVVAAFDPTSGLTTGGTEVTISGEFFTPNLGVEFGGVPAAAVVFIDAQTLVATTPTAAPGDVAVTVVSPTLGSFSAPGSFTFVEPAPLVVLDVVPSSVLPCSPTSITLTGTSFDRAMTVTFILPDSQEFPGEVVSVSSDGQTASVTTPDVGAPATPVIVRVDTITASADWADPFSFSDEFIRGDVDHDGDIDPDDLAYLSAAFGVGPLPGILDAADVNDDGFILVDDLIRLQDFLTGSIVTLPAPFPDAGVDPTPDGLTTVCDAGP
ncbi:MAG: IPT/TIG domain-containing protein, partial [Planctomycetes bacterium]|nr:IPT/TIG domain-containing protein [Planctomycetota bacterium]